MAAPVLEQWLDKALGTSSWASTMTPGRQPGLPRSKRHQPQSQQRDEGTIGQAQNQAWIPGRRAA